MAILLSALPACSSSPTPTAPPPSADEVRSRTITTIRGLASVHFAISHVEGGTDLGGGLTLLSAEGDALFPDRAKLTATATVEGLGAKLQLGIVQIGDTTYLQDPLSRRWRVLEGTLPFDFVGMHDSVAEAFEQTTDLDVEEGPSIGAVSTYLLEGSVPGPALRGLVPAAPEGVDLGLMTWVGREDSLPRRVRLVGPLTPEDPPTMTRVLELSAFDAAVSIEPPI